MNSPKIRIADPLATILIALCAFFLIPTAPAQLASNVISSRYLLVFDTASAMKKRMPATRNTVERLFFSMMNGQLNLGDSIGVWAFGHKLEAGKFPLQQWVPQNAALIASNITTYVKDQHYSGSTRFDVVMPDVNNLVRNSERLTVLIFCDGDDNIKGTPFDKAINEIFKHNERALNKNHQAFIVVLRSQFGQYVGYTVNSSGTGVSFPEFPPLPLPPKPAPAPKTNPPPVQIESKPRPVIQMPPLVIIGTNVGTNVIHAAPSTPMATNPPPDFVKSNPPPAAESVSPFTNAVTASVTNMQTTNAHPPLDESPTGLTRNGAMAIGGALLLAAVVLILVALVRGRSNRGSLISDAMKKK